LRISVLPTISSLFRACRHGSCYEAIGKPKEAARASRRQPSISTDVNAAENMNSAARNYGKAGEKETAIELYKKVKKKLPTSTFARDADRYIAGLAV